MENFPRRKGRREWRASVFAAIVICVAGGGVAGAQAPAVEFELTPNLAARPSALQIQIDGSAAASDPRTPKAVSFSIQRGFVIDPRARARRCTPEQAESYRCPDRSRIGSGTAVVTASGPVVPGGSKDFTAGLQLFLAPPPKENDLAGVVVSFYEPETKQRGTTTGRIIRRRAGAFGYELRFAGVGSGESPYPGVTIKLKSLDLRIAARRRRAGRTHHLIRNPRSCDGTWTARGEVRFTDGSSTARRLQARCRPRA